MSQQDPKTEEQLSDEQLDTVAGGLNERFEDARDVILNKSSEEELSEKDLEGVTGGLNDRFRDSYRDNLNS
ncbi:hypothetical protein C7B61_11135 [filamentous cyanobacterium CCP1]|nr:hypothetical protein C7B76_23005 [filamentous cyanobacterium CCP2]PSB65595.1 hypothetical protein C7B61_11135 [filamentous cyanobacterium CCP1]